jgi:hypothetical protein
MILAKGAHDLVHLHLTLNLEAVVDVLISKKGEECSFGIRVPNNFFFFLVVLEVELRVWCHTSSHFCFS